MIMQSVTVTGDNEQRSATLTREPGELVICSLHLPTTLRVNEANATDEYVWSVAAQLQEALDCRRGAGGDVREFSTLISTMLQ